MTFHGCSDLRKLARFLSEVVKVIFKRAYNFDVAASVFKWNAVSRCSTKAIHYRVSSLQCRRLGRKSIQRGGENANRKVSQHPSHDTSLTSGLRCLFQQLWNLFLNWIHTGNTYPFLFCIFKAVMMFFSFLLNIGHWFDFW